MALVATQSVDLQLEEINFGQVAVSFAFALRNSQRVSIRFVGIVLGVFALPLAHPH